MATVHIMDVDGATGDGDGAGSNCSRPPAIAGVPASLDTARRRSSCHIRSVTRGLVANHPATAVRKTDPMPSHATARSCARCDDHGSWNDNDLAVRAASAIGPAMKAGATAARYLDRHAGRGLARCKRHGLHSASRQSQNESKSDKPVHSFSPCIAIAPPIMNPAASARKERIRRFLPCLPAVGGANRARDHRSPRSDQLSHPGLDCASRLPQYGGNSPR